MNEETQNAVIGSTMLGWEDHGIFTFYLQLDYGSSGQGAGGYSLDAPMKKDGKFIRRIGTASGTELLMRVMKVVGVSKWEDLKGKHIRARGTFSKVSAIGNLLKDEWLDFDEFFKEPPK